MQQQPGHRRRAVVGVRRTTLTFALGPLLLASTLGCTGDPDAPPSSAPSPTPSAAQTATLQPRPVPLRVRVTRVAGRMRPKDQDVLAARVGHTVGAWFEDAHLGGDHPRSDYSEAFDGFTRDAAQMARGQRELLTNAELGPQAQAVVPRRRAAYLSVLAPRGVAAGVTARVDLRYVVDGAESADRLVVVTGRLLLTRAGSGWKIFGYDLQRSARAVKGES